VRKKTPAITAKELARLYKSGLSAKKIGDRLKVSGVTVRRYMKKYKIKKRSHSETIRIALRNKGARRQASRLVWVRVPPGKLHLFSLV
jgi:DNA-binding CsgD family transcriptional regulator